MSSRLFPAFLLALAIVGLRTPVSAADDLLQNRQWGLNQIHAPAAWAVSTGKDVKIGIVDTGVNRNHEDLAGKVVASATCVNTGPNGDPANCSAGGDDIHGHGTHVAGIAGGLTGNGAGIASAAPGAKFIVARVFARDPDGGEPTAELSDVKAGIEWVVSQGAQIVNLSLGVGSQSVTCALLGGCDNPLGPAVQDAWTRGALPVIASGNGNQEVFGGGPGYANLDAIVVGATGMNGNAAAYSEPIGNAKWGIMAPGGDAVSSSDQRCANSSRTDCPMILSTFAGDTCSPASGPSCYAYLAGTSMATPHVSGAAALLFARGLSRQEVVDRLLSTADPMNCGNNCAGRLNAARAVGTVDNTPTTSAGNNGGAVRTTAARTPTTGTSRVATTTSTTPTTAPFIFEQTDPPTTLYRPPRAAIVLNAPPADEGGVPVGVGLVGVGSLAAAAIAVSYNLRKTLTTLP